MKRKYFTEEERKQHESEYNREYFQRNKERLKVIRKDYLNEYHKTPMGRAVMLVNGYQQKDKKYKRGDCTITGKWVVENIFSKPCHYCGETDWTKIGCDRIDRLKPHTPDNVVPCCWKCNCKRHTKSYEEFKQLFIK